MQNIKNKFLIGITVILLMFFGFIPISMAHDEQTYELPVNELIKLGSKHGGSSGSLDSSVSPAPSYGPGPVQSSGTIDVNDYNPGSQTVASGSSKLESKGKKIVSVIGAIGSIAAVVVLIIIGIKYMLGSVEEKAEYKKMVWPYLVGALMLFGISTILEIVAGIFG